MNISLSTNPLGACFPGQQLLETCLQVILQEKNNENDFSHVKNTLSRDDKVLTSRLIKAFKELALSSKSQLKEELENIGSISSELKDYLYNNILANIYMSR